MPVVELGFDSSGALVGAKDYDTAASRVSSSTDTMMAKTREFANVAGTMVAAALAAAGVAVAAFAAKTIQLASNLEETQNKFNVVFDGMTEKANIWAKDLNDNYRLTEEASKAYLASIQDLLVPMGMAKDAAGEMSYATVKLASDLGSFNNVETAQVMDDITSALVGNYETMKKYGVVLNAANVEQQALTMGLATTKDALTAADKAEAAHALIMAASSAAIGDTARSTNSYAAQVREAQKNVADLGAKIGQILLPVMTQLITAFNTFISNQNNVNKVMGVTVSVAQAMYNGFKGVQLILNGLIVGFAYLIDGTVALVEAFRPVERLAIALGAMKESVLDTARAFANDFKQSALDALAATWAETEKGNAMFDQLKVKIIEGGDAFEYLKAAGVDAGNAVGEALGNATESAGDLAAAQTQVNNTPVNVPFQANGEDYVPYVYKAIGAANEFAAANERVNASAGGGKAGGSSRTSVQFPDWFTPGMMAAWNEEQLAYMKNQDYIWNPGVSTGPGGGAAFPGGRPGGRGPGDPADWARGRGYANGSEVNTSVESQAGGVTVNVNQSYSKDELASLITELQRAQARG